LFQPLEQFEKKKYFEFILFFFLSLVIFFPFCDSQELGEVRGTGVASAVMTTLKDGWLHKKSSGIFPQWQHRMVELQSTNRGGHFLRQMHYVMLMQTSTAIPSHPGRWNTDRISGFFSQARHSHSRLTEMEANAGR
jgi:hypothetical protein